MSFERLRARDGLGIVEVLVALTVILFCMMSAAAGTAALARMSGGSAGSIQRTASMTDLIGFLSTLPWSEIPGEGTACVDLDDPFPHERCVVVEDVSASRKRLTAIVTPTDPRIPPDTLVVDRGRPLGESPLSSP